VCELSVKFSQQQTHFESPRSGADHLLTNIESYFSHALRQSSELRLC